jgi:hypothetical protein
MSVLPLLLHSRNERRSGCLSIRTGGLIRNMADCSYAGFELVIKGVVEVQELGEWLRDGL